MKRFRLELLLAVLVLALFGDYVFSSQLLYGSDMIPKGLSYRHLLVSFVEEFKELPRWNPFVLGGLPFIDALHGDTFFPASILQYVTPTYRGVGLKLVLTIFLAGVFMAFYLRSLGLGARAVAFGALCYMLCPIFVSYIFAGQDGKMYVVSLTPLVLGFLERAMRTGGWREFVGLGVSIGFTILSAQIQMAYHAMWYVAVFFCVRLVLGAAGGGPRPAPVRAIPGFLVAIALGLMIASIQLLPAYRFVNHPAAFSVRSERTDYEHAASWSTHPEEVASMIVPEFCNSPEGYWGRNVFKLNSEYVGIFTLFLAGLALSRKRDATRWTLAGISLFAILYSMGVHTPLHRLFFAIVPGVKLFRAPSLVMFGAAFGLSALAALAIHDLEKDSGKEGRWLRRVTTVGFSLAALLALAGLGARGVMSAWNDLFYPAIGDHQLNVQVQGVAAFRTGALLAGGVLAAGTALYRARARGSIDPRFVFGGLIVLTVIDLWRVDQRFKLVVPPERFIVADRLLAPLQEESRREKFRVMPVARQYAQGEMTYFGIESVLGFHDNELAWYRELRSAPEAAGLLAGEAQGFPLLRMLNVKYILHESPDLPNPLRLEEYQPRFWLASHFEVEADRSRIPARLVDPAFDVATTVVLEEDPGIPSTHEPDPPGRITGYEYQANEILIDVEVDRECLLVHSENWFPYWHVRRGDEELPLLRANGVIRATPLEPGTHSLRYHFVSPPYEIGKRISWSTLALTGLLLIGAAVRKRRTAHGDTLDGDQGRL